MAISKSTPYVRYKKDFTSSLHLGTIHIESEYLDRTQKTTIESIHGMTWHNKVVNENKELNLLSDTQLELTELEKQYWNTGEKRVSVDEIHTLEEVEPNEDGTYTYTVNSMEGEYIEIYDGINNITSTSDGLDGQFEIVYDTTEEDVSGNIALDNIVPQYEIVDSGVGAITGAKSTGLTLVNNITESSKEEVVAIGEYEGQYFTIENTVQGNIKSAILKGQTLVNLTKNSNIYFKLTTTDVWQDVPTTVVENRCCLSVKNIEPNTKYIIKILSRTTQLYVRFFNSTDSICNGNSGWINSNTTFTTQSDTTRIYITLRISENNEDYSNISECVNIILLKYQDGMENWDIPYFEGMQSVKMPVLKTVGKNLFDVDNILYNTWVDSSNPNSVGGGDTRNTLDFTKVKPNQKIIASGLRITGAYGYDANKKFIESISSNIITTTGVIISPNVYYVRLTFDNTVDFSNAQLEYDTPTPYEPYQSNILTANEEVELRGIGDVKDELNLLTGESTQYFGEVIFDGSEDEKWSYSPHTDNFYIQHDDMMKLPNYLNKLVCNCLPITSVHGVSDESYYITGYASTNIYPGQNWVYVKINNITTVDGLKNYLQSNPIHLVYPLANPTVKTVDLTVQNQDGGTIPHIQTQQGVTHVSTSSDGLSPVVEMSCSYDTIIKPNTTYTIKLDRPNVSDTMYLQVDLGGTMMMLDADVNTFTIKTPSTLSHSQLRLSGVGNTVKEIIVLEGNRVNDKIEYFEGMKNVENPILIVSNCQYVFGKGGRL